MGKQINVYGSVLDFNVTKVQHQRNGISGRPFHHVFFSYEEKGGAFHPNMLAIVPDKQDGAKPDLCECYVVDLNAPEECWRGDNFHDPVMDAIDNHRKAEDKRWNESLQKGRKLSASRK
jgi:hypothetical protein